MVVLWYYPPTQQYVDHQFFLKNCRKERRLKKAKLKKLHKSVKAVGPLLRTGPNENKIK